MLKLKRVKNKDLPRWFRLLRYGFNCMWYHVLMPLGQKNDPFMDEIKK